MAPKQPQTVEKSRNRRASDRVNNFFIYTLYFKNIALGPDIETTKLFNIHNDADFRLEQLSFWAYDSASLATTETANATYIPPLRVDVLNTSNGRTLTDTPTLISNIFGISCARPAWLKYPIIWRAGSQISVTTINNPINATVEIDLRLSFIGAKVFK